MCTIVKQHTRGQTINTLFHSLLPVLYYFLNVHKSKTFNCSCKQCAALETWSENVAEDHQKKHHNIHTNRSFVQVLLFQWPCPNGAWFQSQRSSSFFLFPPCLLVVGWPLQDCLLLPKKNPVDLYIKEIYLACGWLVIKVMVSAQVRIFSASASGISIANSSSTAIRTSTWSSESKPRSST